MRLGLTRPRLMGLVMYRLPHGIRDCLTAASAAFRNGNQAVALATFLARFWSTPRRICQCFPIDRRALANRSDLGLTEARIRGAIRVLEAIGFLTRKATPGSSYRPTAGGLRRKPILYEFGRDYLPGFLKANRRAKNSPKDKSSEAERVLMGQQRTRLPRQDPEISRPSPYPGKAGQSHTPVKLGASLESALDRLRVAMGIP
jgi:hypothetical protein